MITKGDDYPIHQTPEPVQQVFTSDRNFYDRFFFNGYFREGEPYFAAAMGIYPNVGIIDAAFSVIVGGVQHCVRASRALGADRLDTKVGPISIEIGQPMRSVRLRVDHADIKADLEFQARAHAIEEPRFTRRNPENGRLMMDLTRFTQHGGYAGKLTLGGKTYDAAPSRVWGSRDRSWGVRPVGPQAPGVPERYALPIFLAMVAHQLRRCLHSFRRQRKSRRLAMARVRRDRENRSRSVALRSPRRSIGTSTISPTRVTRSARRSS